MNKRYNKSTAKKHVMGTKPYRVTKQTRMDSYENTDLSKMYDEIDNNLQNILVAIANSPVEMPGIALVNQFLMKITKKMKQIQKKQGK